MQEREQSRNEESPRKTGRRKKKMMEYIYNYVYYT